MSQPTYRRPGRPRAEEVKARAEPQPVKVVTIEVAGIECPGCKRNVQPRINATVSQTRYAICPNCQVHLRMDYDADWNPLKIQVLW